MILEEFSKTYYENLERVLKMVCELLYEKIDLIPEFGYLCFYICCPEEDFSLPVNVKNLNASHIEDFHKLECLLNEIKETQIAQEERFRIRQIALSKLTPMEIELLGLNE